MPCEKPQRGKKYSLLILNSFTTYAPINLQKKKTVIKKGLNPGNVNFQEKLKGSCLSHRMNPGTNAHNNNARYRWVSNSFFKSRRTFYKYMDRRLLLGYCQEFSSLENQKVIFKS